MQNFKTRQNFTSRNVRFNENNLPCFQNETEDIEDNFIHLDYDEVRGKLQDTNISRELSSEVELSEIRSVQESENNTETEVEQETKQEKPSPSVKSKPKVVVQFNQKVAVNYIAFTNSSTCQKLTTKKINPTSRLKMIGKLGQIAIPSEDQKTFQL